jgi:phosphatidylglycerophosphate synthase
MSETSLEARSRLLGDRPDRDVVLRFVLACLVLTGPVIALALALTRTGAGAALAASAFAAMAIVTGLALNRTYPHSRLGLANVLTLSRAAIIAGLCAPLSQPGLLADNSTLSWWVLAIAVFALCLDGFDGYWARRAALTSAFGARFDMEIDSVLALLLALLALQSGKAGLWVLVLGGMRYLFVAASFFWPWLNGHLPERQSRKVICVIQIGVLIALLAPIVSGAPAFALAGVATALLSYSFGRDIVWLARHRE